MLGVYNNLQRAQRAMTADAEDVRRASEALRIVEIELFRLAYRNWFGRRAAESELERPFMRYLKCGVVPVWVRHMAREVLHCAQSGELDRRRYGLPAIDDGPAPADAFADVSHIFVLLALLVVLILPVLNFL